MMLTWWRGGNAGRRQNRGTRRVAPCETKTESYAIPRIHHSETKLWTEEDDTSLQRVAVSLQLQERGIPAIVGIGRFGQIVDIRAMPFRHPVV